VIILEKTITYLQQVTAENDRLKNSITLQDGSQDSNSVTLQAMQNQIAILEKENEFLRKRMNFLPDDSSSLDDMVVSKEPQQPFATISTTELAELKALEMIRKLLDSVQKHHGQGGRVQETLKELSTKKLKMMHTCTKSDSDQSYIPSNGLPDNHKTDAKRKQNKEFEEISTKKVKTEFSYISEHIPKDVIQKDNSDAKASTFANNLLLNGTSNHNVDN